MAQRSAILFLNEFGDSLELNVRCTLIDSALVQWMSTFESVDVHEL